MSRELWATNGSVRIEVVEWTPASDGVWGLPIVCIHGALGTAWSWELEGEAAAAGRLGDRPRALGAFSRRGMGHSDAPSDGYALEDFVGDTRAAIAALGYQRMILVAHSLGVPMAIAYGAAHPREVVGIVLGDYPPLYPSLDETWAQRIESRYRQFRSWDDAYSMMGRTGDEQHDRARFEQIKHHFLRELPNGEIASLFSLDGIHRMREQSRAQDLDEELAALRCPVLLVTGDQPDAMLKAESRDRYDRALGPACETAVIGGAGHPLTVAGRSEPFHAALRAFVSKLDAREG